MRMCACRGTAGFAHVSCLAEQSKILVEDAEEDNLYGKVLTEQWHRWSRCSLCEQKYHGVVACALGWACWKTNVGRPEGDMGRRAAMNVLAGGLHKAEHNEDALSVQEADLAMMRRLGTPENHLLGMQGNLANTYQVLGQLEKALSMRRDVYSGRMRLNGEEHKLTCGAANNYALSLNGLQRYAEAKALLRKTVPVARRVLGENDDMTLRIQWNYAEALWQDDGATLDNVREAVNTLEDTEQTARRVLGGAHPTTITIGQTLQNARAALGDDVEPLHEAVEAMTPGDA